MTRRERAELDCLLSQPSPPNDWPWERWLTTLFPDYVTTFAPHHADFWTWVWAIQAGVRPAPFIGIWPRGGGKSTAAELATTALGARQQRRYALYVRATQELADRSVENIATLLETPSIARHYPELGQPQRGKFGNIRGWRRERLRAANGFTVDAFGFDTALRGAKVDEQRPDLLVLDDIDEKFDNPAATAKKIESLTTSLLPAGAADMAVLGIQNLIIPDGIVSQLADGRAEFLMDRLVSGPYPAVRNLTYELRDKLYWITGGEPVWQEQDLTVCQEQIRTWGLTAFLQEAQHQVDAPAGGMYDHVEFQRCAWADLPELVRTVVWVDPAVTSTDQSDSMGIQADGIAKDGTIYRLWSWEAVTSPEDALQRAIRKALELGALTVGVETDQGGDTWESVYKQAVQGLGLETAPRFTSAKAGAGHGGKAERSSQMLADYDRGRITHVTGTHAVLERALRRFPKTKPLDLADAAFWAWHDLREGSNSFLDYLRGRNRSGAGDQAATTRAGRASGR